MAVAKGCAAIAGVYCGLGLQVPLPATGMAALAVVIVRIILWRNKQSLLWNMSVLSLSVLAAVSTLEGDERSLFVGFWIGVGYGALGVGIIEIGKSWGTGAIKSRLQEAGRVLLGIKKGDEQ